MTTDHIAQRYERYIAACNDRRFDDLARFVDDGVSGERSGLDGWRQGLRNVTVAFPDFHWEIEDLIVSEDGASIAARLTDTGTHRATFDAIGATGRRISIQELAVYRLDQNGMITHCWGDLSAALRSELLPT